MKRILIIVALLAGCAQDPTPEEAASPPGGAELWSRNCMQCHLMRSPTEYDDVDWDVAVHHMRVRAALTPEEGRAIAEFLQSAN
jgi:hypothetical protein